MTINVGTAFWEFARQVGHLIVAAGGGVVLFFAFRWLWRQSRAIGLIVAVGILGRALVGQSLFWLSFLHLPVFNSLQLGEGFWAVTPDARSYYRYAAAAVDSGLWGINPGDSSPFYVRMLALWMRLVGVSPAAGLFLNLSIYIGLCVLLVWAFRPKNHWWRDLPCVVSAAAFSFSPVLVIHGTQPLKEDLFSFLITVVCVGMHMVFRALVYGSAESATRFGFFSGLMIVFGANYGVAGIRPYYAVIVTLAFAFVATVFAFWRRARPTIEYTLMASVALSLLWFAYWQGAGTAYWGPALSSIPRPTNAFSALERVRTRFVLAGGNTNIASAASLASTAEASRVGRSGSSLARRAKSLMVGLAAVFVPISFLKALSIVNFSGGRGLLPIADVDTVFMDVTLLVMLGVLYSRRHAIGNRLPFVVFALTLSVLTACLLGYVVTNFGSLFRIKSMVAVPIWALCLAVAPENHSKALQPLPNTAEE